MTTSCTTSGNEWQRLTKSDNEWQPVITNNNGWQWMIQASGTTSDNEREQVK